MTPTPTTAARVSGTIKACPFCGSLSIKEASDGWGNVFHKCTICRARGPSRRISLSDPSPHQADWDKRAAIQPDPEPQPVAWEIWWTGMPEYRHLTHKCPMPNSDLEIRPLYATPSSAGTVSVEAAARALLDTYPNPIFDQLKPILMGEVTERVGYTDEDGNEAYYDRHVSWDAMKEIIRASLRALAGEGGR